MRRRMYPMIVLVALSAILCAQGRKTPTTEYRIAFASHDEGKQGIYVARTDGSPPVRLTTGKYDLFPRWSPGGTKIAFLSVRGKEDEEALRKYGSMFFHWIVWVMDADGTNLKRLTQTPAHGATWSPDGKKIAFVSGYEDPKNHHAGVGGNSSAIYVMDADGKNEKRITDVLGYDRQPSWSPDGTRLLYVSGRKLCDICSMKADGTDKRNLSNSTSADRSPIWSPDGRRIVFCSDRGGASCIYAMDPDGKTIEMSGIKASGATALGCLPNDRIVYSSGPAVYAAKLDGTHQSKLATIPKLPLGDPALSADGATLAYVTKDGIEAVQIDEGTPRPVTKIAGAWTLSIVAVANKRDK